MSQWLSRPITSKSLFFFYHHGLQQRNEVLHKVVDVFRSNSPKIRLIWFLLLVTTNSILPSVIYTNFWWKILFLSLFCFILTVSYVIVKYILSIIQQKESNYMLNVIPEMLWTNYVCKPVYHEVIMLWQIEDFVVMQNFVFEFHLYSLLP